MRGVKENRMIDFMCLQDLVKKLLKALASITTININSNNQTINYNITEMINPNDIKEIWQDIEKKDIEITIRNFSTPSTDIMFLHKVNKNNKNEISMGKYLKLISSNNEKYYIRLWLGVFISKILGKNGVYIWFTEEEYQRVNPSKPIRQVLCGELPMNTPLGTYLIKIDDFSNTDTEKNETKLKTALENKLKQFLNEIFQ